ncbi:HCRTR2, partial [Cordylochernes scorpioides]
MSVSVSVLTLTFISMDRWYAICRPLRFKSTAAKARTAIGVIWAVSGVLVLPEALVLETRSKPGLSLETELLTECYPTWSPRHSRNYQIFLVTVLFVLPFILMSVAYYQIARVLWNKNIPGASETSTRFKRNCTMRGTVKNGSVNTPVVEPQIRSRRKAAKMLIAVVVMFGLCYVPVHLINTLRYTVGLPQNMVTTVFALLSHWLCYFNSAVNPVIYNVMN